MDASLLQAIASIVTPVVMVICFWRLGGNTASAQVITTYKEQVTQLRDQVSALTAKVGELAGIIKEKDDRIKTLESIATNRNPEVDSFMRESRADDQAIKDLLVTLVTNLKVKKGRREII